MRTQRPTLDEHVQNLQAGFFGGSRDLKEADPIEPTPMMVTIDKIKEYERNPRRERNEAYDLIKGSIRQRGFAGALPITRRPGDSLYMVAEGGNTVLRVLKELYQEPQDERFGTVPCLFTPWISESETLIAHLVENDARGDLMFIDRAHAVQDLRGLLEQERGALLSAHQLAALLRERGYSIDHSTIVRLVYAAEVLLPLIPRALRAGLGAPQVKRVRAVEELCVRFLEHRQCDATTIKAAKRWFLECLARHDREDWIIEPVEYELEAHLAEVCGESIAMVRADFDAIKNFGAPGPNAPAPIPFNLPERGAPERAASEGQEVAGQSRDECFERGTRRNEVVGAARTPPTRQDAVSKSTEPARKSPRLPASIPSPSASTGDDEVFGDQVFNFEEYAPGDPAAAPPPARTIPVATAQSPQQTDLPQDVKSLRGRMWTLATQLAQRYGLGECILTCAKGCGFLVDLPEHPPFAGTSPESPEDARRVMLWWMLAGLADEWPYGLGLAPALALLQEASIYPAIQAVAEGDEVTPTRTLVPRVGFPPSLAIAPRELLAVLDDRDYERLVQLIDARRALQAHCRRLGKQKVWDV